MEKLVYGVGLNDRKYSSRVNKLNTKEYSLWLTMLQRCYDEKVWARHQTYKDCAVSENFKNYSFFYEWCQGQVGFGDVDDGCHQFQLDKDLLIKGNKVYSEDTCVFLPQEINKMLLKNERKRGDYIIGVCYDSVRNKFRAKLTKVNKKYNYLGRFNTEIEAFNAYKVAKELYIKELAEKWKDKIDTRAYNALMNYQVEITD